MQPRPLVANGNPVYLRDHVPVFDRDRNVERTKRTMARIALIAASGRAGSRILKEFSDRGHMVTAIARNPEKIASLPKVTAKKSDVSDKNGLAALLRGQ
jgi:NADP-dependent 3-hydroxy acid dehydrogenase YdfG